MNETKLSNRIFSSAHQMLLAVFMTATACDISIPSDIVDVEDDDDEETDGGDEDEGGGEGKGSGDGTDTQSGKPGSSGAPGGEDEDGDPQAPGPDEGESSSGGDEGGWGDDSGPVPPPDGSDDGAAAIYDSCVVFCEVEQICYGDYADPTECVADCASADSGYGACSIELANMNYCLGSLDCAGLDAFVLGLESVTEYGSAEWFPCDVEFFGYAECIGPSGGV